ncbi:MAG: aminotransferase class V-fold PLP-dependent enzyme [Polyangiales bacterium]
MTTLTNVRASLPSATASAYLNAGTFGPLPTPAALAMSDHLRETHETGRIGVRGFKRWLQIEADARAAFARVIGASPDDVALTHCTTDGVNLTLSGLDWREGDEVLTGDAEHPGLLVPLAELARRKGVTVARVAIADAIDPVATLAEAMTLRTKLVAISHVLWTTGRVLPVAAIAAMARAAGALTLIDGAQAIGAVPVDVPATGSDFYTVSGQKWLCGPSGTGALYVSPTAREKLSPSMSGYSTMNSSAPGGPAPWATARRFDSGTITLTALVGATASIAWREEIGAAWALASARDRAENLRSIIAGRPGLRVAETFGAPSTIVSIAVEGRAVDRIAVALEAEGVLVRSIPGTPYVRASVGFWNDARDVERLVEGLTG